MALTLIKQPSENRMYDMDFSSIMRTDEAILSVISITANQAGITFGSSSINGNIVQFTVAGGTVDLMYKITVLIQTSRDPVKEGEGYLLIKEL